MKKSLCVIFGGKSPEHEISLKSVTSVLRNLDREKYDIHMLGITKDGKWLLYTGDVEKIESGLWEKEEDFIAKAIISPDTSDGGLIVFENGAARLIKLDCIFPVLHGEFGEDGTIQGLFEMSGIKYVGVGVAGSANSMDKTLSKIVFQNAGIPQAAWVTVTDIDDVEEKIKEIENELGYPCFVKPASTGSSVGVGKAASREELKSAIDHALKFGRKVLVEENIDGREVECAILGNREPKASEIGEIVPEVEFYDFDAKYNSNSTRLDIPAILDEKIKEEIKAYAIKAFRAVDGMGLSRVDFFVRKSDNKVILNEINTLPGFTNISMYPKLWGVTGVEYSSLLDKLIELAEKRVK